MQNQFLHTPIEYLKGVGPLKGEVLKTELGIFTFGDLLNHFPFRYVDRSKFFTISQLNEDMPFVQLKGKITEFNEIGEGRGKRLSGRFEDQTGEIELVWFKNIKWIKDSLVLNKTCIIFGKPSLFVHSLNMVHPEVEWIENNKPPRGMQPVYNLTEKLKNSRIDSKAIYRMIQVLFENKALAVEEVLPDYILTKYQLESRQKAYRIVHLPETNNEFAAGQMRFKFEELFFLNVKIAGLKNKRKRDVKGFVFRKIDYNFNSFYKSHLPFELTDAQKKVLKEIRADMATGKQMNRLLQGDVGSGKTIVALLSMLIALDNGTQAAIMAPTEILANQHFESIGQLVSGLGLRIEILTSNTKKAKKAKILEQLIEGQIDIMVGTHALIENDVVFKNPGLVIIDEQHRFGVAQRAKLWNKHDTPPHVLVMTATPIPRTLAMTVYGDLDVSKIDQMPEGRKAIKTVHRFETRRHEIFDFLKSEIANGRQAYYVYPLIQESETLDYQNLLDGFHKLKQVFPETSYKIGMVHGKMKAKDKDIVMNAFKKGDLNMLVSTTVIEVGVNVPNASVMVIENSERFGLSQLHQLRGRVGRGAEQSYCILLSSVKLGQVARERIKAMLDTTDGFEIANLDLKLRGPGDLLGTQQSGLLDLKIADLIKDEDLLIKTRMAADELLKDDPLLMKPENIRLRNWFEQLKRVKGDWSRVS
ncbi:MAG: ATP-dependent DNA helicase RecG [Bacteroidia bacterium]